MNTIDKNIKSSDKTQAFSSDFQPLSNKLPILEAEIKMHQGSISDRVKNNPNIFDKVLGLF